MPSEVSLLESRSLRGEHQERVDMLDKVKALVMLPDRIHLRTEDVARYFEVSTEVVRQVTARHRGELAENGMRVLRGSELRRFHSDIVSLWTAEQGESYPQAATQLTLYTRRSVLNIAMLLRDSDIARCVRTYLLDAEEGWRESHAALERRVTNAEVCLAAVGTALQELGPVLHRMSLRLDALDRRLDTLDRRLDATNQVVAAISNRLCEMSADINRLDSRVDGVVHQLRDLRRTRKRR